MLPVELHGVVTPYKGNGRKLGYPTANIATDTSLQDGVYFGHAAMGTFVRQPALIFVGTPVTVGDTERRVEAHLLDVPDVNYYGQEITLDIQHFHRSNQKFDSMDELLEAIRSDELAARKSMSVPVTKLA
jgi:riboflavin kinase/FMN adenylyltransferase